jgi:hypothetical protein
MLSSIMKRNTLLVLSAILLSSVITFLITAFLVRLSAKDKLVEQQNNYDTAIYFNEICMGAEYVYTIPVTRKFDKPAKLFLVKDSSYSEQTKFVTRVLKEFNQLTTDGFKIKLTKDSATANMHLFLCSRKNLKNIPRFANVPEDKVVFGHFDSRFNNNIITDAVLFVNTTKPLLRQKEAILEEIVQSVGFFRDSDFYSNSVFYQYKYSSNIKTLTLSVQDKEIIRLLYSPNMKAGLTKRQAMDINMMALKK